MDISISSLGDSLFEGNSFLFFLEFFCDADKVAILYPYLAPNIMPDEVFQAYKMLGNFGITRHVSAEAINQKLCRHSKAERGVMGYAHKWAHINTACTVANCDHSGRSLKAMCIAGVQNNEQRGRSFAGTSVTNRELDAAHIF